MTLHDALSLVEDYNPYESELCEAAQLLAREVCRLSGICVVCKSNECLCDNGPTYIGD